MSAPCSPFSSPSKLPGVNHVAPALSSTGEEATSTTIDDVPAFLPDELARQLKEDLDRQNVGSIYVPREVVWAIGLGGALVVSYSSRRQPSRGSVQADQASFSPAIVQVCGRDSVALDVLRYAQCP